MTGPSLAEVLPAPDPETVRKILGLLVRPDPESGPEVKKAPRDH